MKTCIAFLLLTTLAFAGSEKQDIRIDESCSIRLIDPLQFQLGWLAPPWCFGDHPTARDIWSVLDQTPAIDNERYDVAGENSTVQAASFTRGSSGAANLWFYDGLEVTDPVAAGATGTYFDYNVMSDLTILTGGAAPDTQAGGAVVRIVTRTAGEKWSGNASLQYTGDSLQSDNTPPDFEDTGFPSTGTLDSYLDYGFDAGGSILHQRLFAWGAFQRIEIKRTLQPSILQDSTLKNLTLKTRWQPSMQHGFEFEYFKSDKTVDQRWDNPTLQLAPVTLRHQRESDTILPGILRAQYSWTPSDRWLLDALFGYVGNGFSLTSLGGTDVPVIFLSAIPRYEDTYISHDPIDRASYQFSINASRGGKIRSMDHDWKFGFDYRTSSITSQSSYGNGTLIVDLYQTTPQGPLTSGYVYAQRPIFYKAKLDRTSFYAEDSVHWNRLAFEVGLRFDHQSGKNQPTTLPAVPGYEDLVPAFQFDGKAPTLSFNNLSPRLHASFDLTGDGKTILQGGYARYFDPLLATAVTFVNPTAFTSGAVFSYEDRNGDRTITRDELTGGPSYYGDFCTELIDDVICPSRKFDPSLRNSHASEWIVGAERELPFDAVVQANYMHRKYEDFYSGIPEGATSSDFIPVGNFTGNTVLGVFNVPLYSFAGSTAVHVLTNVPDYSQEYNGFDLTVRKKSGKYAEFSAGLVLQKQKAHYASPEGLAFQIDAGGLPGSVEPLNPTNLPFLNNQPFAYSSSQNGVYPFSEWQFKWTGTAHLPALIDVGAFVRYQQGYPYVLFASIRNCGLESCSGGSQLVLVEPFGSRRYDNLFSMDVHVERPLDLGYGRLTAQLDIFNITNTSTVTQRDRLITSAFLNRVIDHVAPRVFRLGVRLAF